MATWRATRKANRRNAYFEVAAAVFAERGFGGALPDGANRTVGRLQRTNVDRWSRVLAGVEPGFDAHEREVRRPGMLGLPNSTPFSARRTDDAGRPARILATMASAGLLHDGS